MFLLFFLFWGLFSSLFLFGLFVLFCCFHLLLVVFLGLFLFCSLRLLEWSRCCSCFVVILICFVCVCFVFMCLFLSVSYEITAFACNSSVFGLMLLQLLFLISMFASCFVCVLSRCSFVVSACCLVFFSTQDQMVSFASCFFFLFFACFIGGILYFLNFGYISKHLSKNGKFRKPQT